MKKILLLAALAFMASCSDDDSTSNPAPTETLLSENFTNVRIEGHANFTDASFLDENHGVLGAASGVLLRTEDGGASWINVTGPMVSYSNVLMYDQQTVFAARRGFYKMDSANNLESLGGLDDFSGAIRGMHFLSATTGFMVKDSEILKTGDGGNTWEVSYGENDYLKDLVFVTPQVAYAFGGTTHDGASGGVLVKTEDGGNTWTDLQLQSTEVLTMQFTNTTTGYAVNFANEFLKTTDGGTTWEPIGEIPAPEWGSAVSSMLYVSDKQIFVCNFAGQLLKSGNGGIDWEVIYENVDGNALTKIERAGAKIYVVGDADQLLKN